MFGHKPDEEYEVVPIDHSFHTPAHPFCDDQTCPDKDDPELIGEVNELYQDGLISRQEATGIVQGKPSNYGW